MSRKHNTKHFRTPSGYAAKLARQGRGKVAMPFFNNRGQQRATPAFIHRGES